MAICPLLNKECIKEKCAWWYKIAYEQDDSEEQFADEFDDEFNAWLRVERGSGYLYDSEEQFADEYDYEFKGWYIFKKNYIREYGSKTKSDHRRCILFELLEQIISTNKKMSKLGDINSEIEYLAGEVNEISLDMGVYDNK